MAEDDTGRDFTSAEDPRLSALDERLKEARHQEALRTGQGASNADAGYSLGNRVLAALIGSLVGSALIDTFHSRSTPAEGIEACYSLIASMREALNPPGVAVAE